MTKKIALGALGAIAVLVLLFIFLPVVAWILVGLLLLVIAVVLFVPIGADIAYVGGKFSLAARVDGFALQLIPRKPPDPNKPPKEKKEKKPAEPKPQTESTARPRRKLSFTKEEIFELIRKTLQGLGKFGKITIRRFMLHYVAAEVDPYNAAMLYNYVNAALSTLAPICAQKFRVTGDVDVRTDVDFTAEIMSLDIAVSMTIRLAQVVHVGIAVAVGVLGVLIRSKRRQKKEEKLAAKNGGDGANTADQSDQTNDTITEVEITKADERNEGHG